MDYCDLMSAILDAFFEQGMPYPSGLLYPILGLNNKKQAVDRFLVCMIERDEIGNITYLSTPKIICENPIFVSEECTFIHLQSERVNICSTSQTPREQKSSIDIVLEAYMAVRDFAFKDNLSKGESALLRNMLELYSVFFETNIVKLYQTYSPEFYEWANTASI